jgi:copper chaperone CopZ
MMRLGILISLLLFVSLFSCKEEVKSPTATNKAEISVEGMVCEMGCGASLRKGLLESGSVTKVEVSFDEEAPSNVITVFYDKSISSPEQLIEVIEKLNEGQFKAKLIKESPIETAGSQTESNIRSKSNNQQILKVEEAYWSFPNLTDLLNKLVP